MTLGSAMLAEFDHEAANTRRMLERVPADRLDWRPHPKSMTMGQLANHIASLAGWSTVVLSTAGVNLASPEARALQPPAVDSVQALVERFDRNVAAARAAIAGVSDAALAEPWTLTHGAHTLLTMPRGAVLRSMVMNHGIHHRAQLGVYLRLQDIPVPGMYGPSADEA